LKRPSCLALLLLFSVFYTTRITGLLPASPAAGKRSLPVLALARPEVEDGSGTTLPAAALTDSLLAAWEALYGDRAALVPLRFAPAGSPLVRIVLERSASALRVQIRLHPAEGGPGESLTVRLSSGGLESLTSALAGGIFRLWTLGLTGFQAAADSPPPLPVGILDLDALRLLPGAELSDPLDLTSWPGGPLLVFGGGLLRLGSGLEITPETLRDLYFAPQLPPNTRIGAGFLGAGGAPLLVDPADGSLFFTDPGGVQRLETGLVRPEDSTTLPDGSLAMLKGRTLMIFRRRGEGLQTRRVELPPGLYSALAADSENRLWVYDLAERRLRIFSVLGREIMSVTPLLAPGELQFPQTCAVRSDGSFLLGGAGTVFCFEANGLPRWKVDSLPARVREALPASFRVALTPEENGFYLLDLPGNRLLHFRDPDALQATEAAWAAAFPGFDTRDPAQLQAARSFLIAKGLLLQAYLPAALLGEPRALESLGRLAAARCAELSALLAKRLDSELLLPEAEAALKAGLKLYHRLRREDPVDARWPAAILELTARRAALREILFAAPLLKIDLGAVKLVRPAGGKTSDSPPVLEIELLLRNSGPGALRTLRLEARLAGFSPAGESPADSLVVERLDSGRILVRSLSLPVPAAAGAESVVQRLALRAFYTLEDSGARSQYFTHPLRLPRP
jgi:hypothetical protein